MTRFGLPICACKNTYAAGFFIQSVQRSLRLITEKLVHFTNRSLSFIQLLTFLQFGNHFSNTTGRRKYLCWIVSSHRRSEQAFSQFSTVHEPKLIIWTTSFSHLFSNCPFPFLYICFGKSFLLLLSCIWWSWIGFAWIDESELCSY